MLGARLVIDDSAVVRVLRRLEKIFHEIHGVIQKIVVSLADVDVKLAFELWSYLRPITFEDVTEIKILTPVFSDGAIDLAGQLVPDRFRIAVASDGRIHRLPNIKLAAGTAIRPQRQFHVIHVFDSCGQLAEIVSLAGTQYALPLRIGVVSILMLVNIDDGVGAKVDWVRTRSPTSVVLVGIEDLHGHGFPTASRTAVKNTRPAFPNATKTFLDFRNQLVRDRVAVWTKISGVHRV